MPVGTRTTLTAPGTSMSATSHRFVVQTETALAADPFALDLVRLMVETVHFGEHTCVVALGIDVDGVGHPFLLGDVSTDNTNLVTDQQPPQLLPAPAPGFAPEVLPAGGQHVQQHKRRGRGRTEAGDVRSCGMDAPLQRGEVTPAISVDQELAVDNGALW